MHVEHVLMEVVWVLSVDGPNGALAHWKGVLSMQSRATNRVPSYHCARHCILKESQKQSKVPCSHIAVSFASTCTQSRNLFSAAQQHDYEVTHMITWSFLITPEVIQWIGFGS